jgi:RNA polymerase sigma-70 factor (ECF subfamily)
MAGNESDRDLLMRIRAGDKGACDDCIRQHAPAVYRLALRMMRNQAEAEDVMQETFLNAFKGIDRFDGRSGLRTWLSRIAYNAALGRLQRPKPDFVPVDEVMEPEDGTPIPQELFDWTGLPERELERSELRAEMEKAIRGLPGKLRAAFVLRELEGLSTEEAARILGISGELVKMRLHRARLRLREQLSSYFASGTPVTRG